MELEQTDGTFVPGADPRPKLPDPLPVRLIAVSDVRLPTARADLEKLEEFYVGVWGFQPDPAEPGVFHADNFALRFDVHDGQFHREDFRPLVMEIASIDAAEKKLVDLDYEFVREHHLSRATAVLVLKDPAGNWIEIAEKKIVP